MARLAPLLLAASLPLLTPVPTRAQPPPASPASPAPSRPSSVLSGYMDFHFNKEDLQDGRLDFHRFVLLFTHSFSDRLRFIGELELEHAFVEGFEKAGELELEQAYLDVLVARSVNVRAGMLLVPVGIINERHEPPVYYGVERPFVDTVIVPSTWFEAGAGVHGEVGRGVRYRAYVMSPLDAARFGAEEGVRGGRQKGANANVGRPAATGRVEWVGHPGLALGGSFWTGRSGFEFRPRFEVPVTLFEVDARYAPTDRIETRAQFAQISIDRAGELNDTLTRQTGVNPNIARSLRGFYLEAGYRVVSGAQAGEVGVFGRYENFDTQRRMPDGYLPLKQFDRDGWTVGAAYWPDPDVAVKVDYTFLRNQSEVVKAANMFNIGLGWWF